MDKQLAAARNPANVVTVLSVSPLAEDYFSLQAAFKHTEWALYQADGLASALAVIHRRTIAVIICERNLSPGTWIELLEELRPLRNAPALIVTSRLADERLWAEALNLGAYDVLAKPFERRELVRSVSLAWQQWHQRQNPTAMLAQAMRAAS